MDTNSGVLRNGERRKFSVNYLAKIAILGAISWIVMLFEFPLAFIFPSFLKFDFSDIIPLIGSLAMGPVAGILIELIKNALHLLQTTTAGVGDLANFVVGAAFVGVAGLYYKNHKTRNGALISLLFGILSMIIAGALVNYFITIPLYAIVLNLNVDMIVSWSTQVIPAIHDKFTLILFAFCPFNLLKGVVLALITWLLYKKLSPLLHKGL